MSVEWPALVAILSSAVIVISVVCMCRGRLDIELESQAIVDTNAAVELSPNNK